MPYYDKCPRMAPTHVNHSQLPGVPTMTVSIYLTPKNNWCPGGFLVPRRAVAIFCSSQMAAPSTEDENVLFGGSPAEVPQVICRLFDRGHSDRAICRILGRAVGVAFIANALSYGLGAML